MLFAEAAGAIARAATTTKARIESLRLVILTTKSPFKRIKNLHCSNALLLARQVPFQERQR